MREIRALSPTSLMLYKRDPELWYLKYCADEQLPRSEQTKPAAVGSAFDALIKARLYKHYYNEVAIDHPYSARTLLAQQVNPDLMDWATNAGIHCLTQYERCGALADILLETHQPPQFEFPLRQTLTLDGLEVPVYGIPDMSYHYNGYTIILDWKVNGYCAKSVTSPTPGYLICRDGWDFRYCKPSRSHRKMHPDVVKKQLADLTISSQPLEASDEQWAVQLTTYAWLIGGDNDFIGAIEQLCGQPVPGHDQPNLRIASFRGQVSKGFQETLVGMYTQCWLAYKSGHIFLTESREASNARCKFLDNLTHILMKGNPDSSEFIAATEYLKGKDVYDSYRDYRRDIIECRRARGEVGLPDPDDYSGVVDKVTTQVGLVNLPQNGE